MFERTILMPVRSFRSNPVERQRPANSGDGSLPLDNQNNRIEDRGHSSIAEQHGHDGTFDQRSPVGKPADRPPQRNAHVVDLLIGNESREIMRSFVI